MVAKQKWRPYLIGKVFTVITDHQSLKFLLEQKVGTPLQQKWVSKLLGYDVRVEYKKGVENLVADTLSIKDEVYKPEVGLSISALSIPTVEWWDEIKEGYKQDQNSIKLLEQSTMGLLPKTFSEKNGLLFYKNRLFVAEHGDS